MREIWNRIKIFVFLSREINKERKSIQKEFYIEYIYEAKAS